MDLLIGNLLASDRFCMSSSQNMMLIWPKSGEGLAQDLWQRRMTADECSKHQGWEAFAIRPAT